MNKNVFYYDKLIEFSKDFNPIRYTAFENKKYDTNKFCDILYYKCYFYFSNSSDTMKFYDFLKSSSEELPKETKVSLFPIAMIVIVELK